MAQAATPLSVATTSSTPQPPAVSAVSLKLPPFWPNDPQLWFAQVEAQFRTRGITQDTTKFSYVVSSLSHEFAHEVRDLLLSPPSADQYETIKRELIARLSASAQKRIRQLLTEEQLGDRKPSQFLRHLQQLQGDTPVDSALLRELFVQRLPSSVRLVLATASDLPLDQQARLADTLVELQTPPTLSAYQQDARDAGAALPTADHQTSGSDVGDLRADIAALRREFGRLQHRDSGRSEYRRRSQSRGRSRSRGRSPAHRASDDDFERCWYHRRFGDRARHCQGAPCDMCESGNGRASQ